MTASLIWWLPMKAIIPFQFFRTTHHWMISMELFLEWRVQWGEVPLNAALGDGWWRQTWYCCFNSNDGCRCLFLEIRTAKRETWNHRSFFSPHPLITTPSSPIAVLLTDWDGDGKLIWPRPTIMVPMAYRSSKTTAHRSSFRSIRSVQSDYGLSTRFSGSRFQMAMASSELGMANSNMASVSFCETVCHHCHPLSAIYIFHQRFAHNELLTGAVQHNPINNHVFFSGYPATLFLPMPPR